MITSFLGRVFNRSFRRSRAVKVVVRVYNKEADMLDTLESVERQTLSQDKLRWLLLTMPRRTKTRD